MASSEEIISKIRPDYMAAGVMILRNQEPLAGCHGGDDTRLPSSGLNLSASSSSPGYLMTAL